MSLRVKDETGQDLVQGAIFNTGALLDTVNNNLKTRGEAALNALESKMLTDQIKTNIDGVPRMLEQVGIKNLDLRQFAELAMRPATEDEMRIIREENPDYYKKDILGRVIPMTESEAKEKGYVRRNTLLASLYNLGKSIVGLADYSTYIPSSVAMVTKQAGAVADAFKSDDPLKTFAVNYIYSIMPKEDADKLIASNIQMKEAVEKGGKLTRQINYLDNAMKKPVRDWSKSVAETMGERSQKYSLLFNLDPVEAIQKGDLGALAQFGLYGFLENAAPLVLATGATLVTGSPDLGLAMMGLSATGGKFADLQGVDGSTSMKLANATATGLIEVASERIWGFGAFMRRTMGAAKKAGVDKTLKSVVGRFLLHWGKTAGGEAVEEPVSQIGEDVVDFMTGVKEWDGLSAMSKRAFASAVIGFSGGVMMGGASGPVFIANDVKGQKTEALVGKIGELAKARDNIIVDKTIDPVRTQPSGMTYDERIGNKEAVNKLRTEFIQNKTTEIEQSGNREAAAGVEAVANSMETIEQAVVDGAKPEEIAAQFPNLPAKEVMEYATSVQKFMNPQSLSERVDLFFKDKAKLYQGLDQRVVELMESGATEAEIAVEFSGATSSMTQQQAIQQARTYTEQLSGLEQAKNKVIEMVENGMSDGEIFNEFDGIEGVSSIDALELARVVRGYYEGVTPQSVTYARKTDDGTIAKIKDKTEVDGNDNYVFSVQDSTGQQTEVSGDEAQSFKNLKEEYSSLTWNDGGRVRNGTVEKVRRALLNYIEQYMPKEIQYKMLASVTAVKTEADLENYIKYVDTLTEQYNKKLYQQKYKELRDLFNKSKKSMDPDIRESLKPIFESLSIDPLTPKKTIEATKIFNKLRNVVGDMAKLDSDAKALLSNRDYEVLESLGKTSLDSMTADQLKHLVDSVTKAVHKAMNIHTEYMNGKRVEVKEITAETLKDFKTTNKKRARRTIEVLDQLAKLGILHHDVLTDIISSEIGREVLDQEIVRGYRKLYEVRQNAIDMFVNGVPDKYKDALKGLVADTVKTYKFGGKNYDFTESELIEMYIRSKNTEDLRSLVGTIDDSEYSGYTVLTKKKAKLRKISYEAILDLRKTVEADSDMMQVVDTWLKIAPYLHGEVNAVHKRDTGVSLDQSKFYLPRSIVGFLKPESTTGEGGLTPEGKAFDAYTRTLGSWSGLQERTGTTKGLEIRGAWATMAHAIGDASKYVGLREPTKLAFRIIKDQETAIFIKQEFGEHTYKAIKDNLEASMGSVTPEDIMSRGIRNMLNNITLATFGFNIFPAIKTTGSLAVAMNYIEKEFWQATPASMDEVRSDPILRDRVDGDVSPEVNTALYSLGRKGRITVLRNRALHEGMSLIVRGDALVVQQILGMCKLKADKLNPNLSKEERLGIATQMAYEIIRRSQPTFLTIDRPAIRRSNAWTRSIIPFSSQKIQNFNAMIRALSDYEVSQKTPTDKLKMAVKVTNSMIISAVIYSGMSHLQALLMGYGGDKGERGKKFLDSLFVNLFGNIPIAGELAAGLYNYINGNVYGYEFGGSLPIEMLNSVTRDLAHVFNSTEKIISGAVNDMTPRERDRFYETFRRRAFSMVRGASLLTGTPLSPIFQINKIETAIEKHKKENSEVYF